MSGWLVALVECRVCTHKHVSVHPDDVEDEDNLECPRCHAMACQPIYWVGPGDKKIMREEDA